MLKRLILFWYVRPSTEHNISCRHNNNMYDITFMIFMFEIQTNLKFYNPLQIFIPVKLETEKLRYSYLLLFQNFFKNNVMTQNSMHAEQTHDEGVAK